jgi:dTDP-4-amino-4,6-dideoxygalactose transaminase
VGWAGRGGILGLYARHRLDLSLADVAFGLLACARPGRSREVEPEILRLCSLEDDGMLCLSVRSGWDLWLGSLGLRPGDEVMVSAVTHPDMVRIIRGHGLCAVPVDLEPETLAPQPEALEAALTPRTRILLVAHLFGGRMDLGPVASFARRYGLLLVEDCAQAFQGPGSMRDPAPDVSMYSFGTLKTSTALGGAVLRVRDQAVLRRMRGLRAGYPAQRRSEYARKLGQVLLLLAFSRPWPYGCLAWACSRRGHDLDALLNGVVRAFPPGEPIEALFRRLRRRPSTPLLSVLDRRLGTFDGARLARRVASGERVARGLRQAVNHPGGGSSRRTHWLFPVVVPQPEALVSNLRLLGVDASRATSSIGVVESQADACAPVAASRMMSGVVFLPVYPELPTNVLDRVVETVNGSGVRRAEELVRV